ncbi:MAG TPA: S8 family serine peptidase [Solirubrobacterales bacterium]|nr:S8 family serine peptidase [Solirubrobacterales bacterium]
MSRLRLPFVGALLTLLLAAPAASAQGEQAVPNGAPATPPPLFSEARVIVQWAPGADRGDKVAARTDADVDYETNLGSPDFQLVEVEPGQAPGSAVAELEADPAVAVAERDSYSAPHGIPNDPFFNQLWGLQNLGLGVNGFLGAIAGDDANVVAAWDRAVGTPSTVIADLDSGYRFEHPDLGPVAWTNPGEIANGADDDGNGIVDDLHGADFVGSNSELSVLPVDGDPTDDDLLSGGHGVHTAGTMGAAGNNGIGITGVARNVRVMPLRVCSRFPSLSGSRCPISSQINAINYAGLKGARVANMSLGGNSFNQTVINAIAANPHVLFVISAGNDGGDNDGGGAAPKGHHYPCDYVPTDANPDGTVDNIICVAATNQADGLAGFSDWGAVSVDLGAPGTETLSTYPFNAPIDESFQVDDFSSKWTATGTNGGFQRSSEAPLTSFGMTDSPGAAPTANAVRESTSAAASIPAGLAPCNLLQSRNVVPGTGGSYTYSVLLNGVLVDSFTSTSTTAGRFSRELTTKLSPGGAVQVRFRYTAGSAPGLGDGVWLDDIELECAEPVGMGASYEFLQGTSMAAPHVTGAAGLLFSMKPSATVTQVRSALLNSVDPIASLSGKTVTGGRLDVADALGHLVPVGTETVLPETAIISGPEGTTASTAASFQFARTDADVGAFECQVDSGAFSPCASPASFTVAPGSHQFQVRAKVPSGLVDPTPATRSWSVSAPPPPPLPSCKVPKLAGLKLPAAKWR